MDTNTIIELFEELRKQLTSLSRRIDDRNISAPAPVTTDDKSPDCSKRPNSPARMSNGYAWNLQTALQLSEKRLKIIPRKRQAVASSWQPAAQRHIHVIDFQHTGHYFHMAISSIVILRRHPFTKLYDRIATCARYGIEIPRYVQMMGDIDEQKLRNLNALFYDSERRADRRSLRQQVERYETAGPGSNVENRNVARLVLEAEDIRQKAKQFQKELDITK